MTATATMLLKIAECLGLLRYSAATGGSTTTLVDATLEEPDDYLNGGTVFFITGDLAGKTAKVTSWDQPTHTITIPAQTDAIIVGDQYAVLDQRYPRDQLIGALNQALAELGPFDAIDESLAIVDDQWAYDLPAGVQDICRVQFSIETVAPYHWAPPFHYWKEHLGQLHLSQNHPWWAGSAMRLFYQAPHDRVYLDADLVTDAIYPQRLAWFAAWMAAENRMSRIEQADPATKALAERAKGMALTLERDHPIRRMTKDPAWSDLP